MQGLYALIQAAWIHLTHLTHLPPHQTRAVLPRRHIHMGQSEMMAPHPPWYHGPPGLQHLVTHLPPQDLFTHLLPYSVGNQMPTLDAFTHVQPCSMWSATSRVTTVISPNCLCPRDYACRWLYIPLPVPTVKTVAEAGVTVASCHSSLLCSYSCAIALWLSISLACNLAKPVQAQTTRVKDQAFLSI